TTASSPPCSVAACSTAAATASRSVTSTWMKGVAASAGGCRSSTTGVPPPSTTACTTAAPSPELPPVTRTRPGLYCGAVPWEACWEVCWAGVGDGFGDAFVINAPDVVDGVGVLPRADARGRVEGPAGQPTFARAVASEVVDRATWYGTITDRPPQEAIRGVSGRSSAS